MVGSGTVHRLWILSLLLPLGCATARHVEKAPGGGVVAIPKNTNAWPHYYRDKAIALIESEAPHGYEIVFEQEAVAHTDTTFATHTDYEPVPFLELNTEPGPDGAVPRPIINFLLPFVTHRVHEAKITDVRNVMEWRIHYRWK